MLLLINEYMKTNFILKGTSQKSFLSAMVLLRVQKQKLDFHNIEWISVQRRVTIADNRTLNSNYLEYLGIYNPKFFHDTYRLT